MNSVEICELVKRIPGIQNFKGALPIDLVPRQTFGEQNIIVNLDDSTKVGSHWVAIAVGDDGKAHYFDSFAEPIPAELREKFNFASKSTLPVQHLFSSACGRYCIAFLFLHAKKYKIDFIQRYMKKLSDDDLKNFVLSLCRK